KVVFDSWATNLAANDTNNDGDVFVHDFSTGVTRRLSESSYGEPGNGRSDYPSISADGRVMAFESSASNLVAGDTNQCGGSASCTDIFVRAPRHRDNGDGTVSDVITGLMWEKKD